MAFCLGCYFCGVGLSHKPCMSLLNCESTVINNMAKIASLPFTTSGNMDLVLFHDFWRISL